MATIQLQTGKTIYMSTYEWLFKLKEEDVAEFYQSCIADDLGIEIQNPFSNRVSYGKLEVEDIPEPPELSEDIGED